MKLIIQIPCLNEAKTLPVTLADLPKSLPGIDEIEVLIVDDGSTDDTAEVAKQNGVQHVRRFKNNKGLAEAFMTGINTSLELGADIIVNTDADNQYKGECIADLIKPIVEGKADMVIGDRQVETIPHFSSLKIMLQKLGSWVVRRFSETSVPDTTSGFRAYSREAALRLNVISRFTYTLETIIQAGKKNIAVTHVPIQTNGMLRKSRLFRSMPSYIKRSVSTIFRIYVMYEPLKAFMVVGSILFSAGFLIGLRFLYFYFFVDSGAGHIQSLILSAVLLLLGFQMGIFGVIADLIAGHRRLTEDTLYRVKKVELDLMRLGEENDKHHAENSILENQKKQATDVPA